VLSIASLRRLRPARAAGLLAALWLALAPLPAAASGPVTQLAYGAASALSSMIYGPAKLLYALGGGVIAGFAYLFSGGDGAVAEPIIDAAMRGDYVVDPAHLKGEQELHFVGRRPEQVQMESVASGPPDDGF